MSQTDSIIKAMLTGFCSTKDLIDASGSLTPLARLAEWRDEHYELTISSFPSHYPEFYYLINGKDYTEETRQRKVLNRDGKAVQITERKFQRVK